MSWVNLSMLHVRALKVYLHLRSEQTWQCICWFTTQEQIESLVKLTLFKYNNGS